MVQLLQYFALLSHMLEVYPEKVAQLNKDAFAHIAHTLDFGLHGQACFIWHIFFFSFLIQFHIFVWDICFTLFILTIWLYWVSCYVAGH